MPLSRRPAIDSGEAIQSARSIEPDFGPASSDAHGVHFAVDAIPGSADPVILVLGQFGGNPAFVEVDALTGAGVKAAQELRFGKLGGVIYSEDAGLTWKASNLTARFVTGIAAHPTIGDSAFAAVAGDSEIAVYRTDDGGVNWRMVGQLPAAADNWPFGVLAVRGFESPVTVFVGTRKGLWASNDEGATWMPVAGLPLGPIQWLAKDYGATAPRVIVTLSAGPDAGVYSSTDLQTWAKDSSSVARLSESFSAEGLVEVDEARPGMGQLHRSGQPGQLQLPPGTLRIAGALDGSAPLLAESPTGLRISRDGGSTWIRALETSLASIAVAPDFPASGVAVAGGFRTGIYRTTDGGQHWIQVIADPSEVVPGNGEIATVTFLSPQRVLATNGGSLQWQKR